MVVLRAVSAKRLGMWGAVEAAHRLMGVTFGTPVVSLPQTLESAKEDAIKKALEIWFWVDGPEAAAGALAAGKANSGPEGLYEFMVKSARERYGVAIEIGLVASR